MEQSYEVIVVLLLLLSPIDLYSPSRIPALKTEILNHQLVVKVSNSFESVYM